MDPIGSAPERLRAEIAADIDSLHILPLSTIPLETPALARARLIKNSRLETVIEVYHGPATGSGQVSPSHLERLFPDVSEQDKETIIALGQLNSFDVYSLRIDLRRLGIAVNDHSALCLSDEKKTELLSHMRGFTAPLLRYVFGSSDVSIKDVEQLYAMFSSPDKSKVRQNLAHMAEKLDIDMGEVPIFLEEYGDIFLSLAYYKQCFDKQRPIIDRFVRATHDLERSFEISSDPVLMETLRYMRTKFAAIASSISQRFEGFDRESKALWNNISAETFQAFRRLIESHHKSVGAILCGLEVKLTIWQEHYHAKAGGPLQLANFIMSHMKSGMELILQFDGSAGESPPAKAALQ